MPVARKSSDARVKATVAPSFGLLFVAAVVEVAWCIGIFSLAFYILSFDSVGRRLDRFLDSSMSFLDKRAFAGAMLVVILGVALLGSKLIEIAARRCAPSLHLHSAVEVNTERIAELLERSLSSKEWLWLTRFLVLASIAIAGLLILWQVLANALPPGVGEVGFSSIKYDYSFGALLIGGVLAFFTLMGGCMTLVRERLEEKAAKKGKL
jgi:hypothetical protein